MLNNAARDLQAVRHMQDVELFDTEIFGFHVQQCIEKSLKAWLAFRGLSFPKSHDLSALKTALEDS
ncbi:MAG: HEPN domain-containing protein [Cyanobacteria bacterium J06639_1]